MPTLSHLLLEFTISILFGLSQAHACWQIERANIRLDPIALDLAVSGGQAWV